MITLTTTLEGRPAIAIPTPKGGVKLYAFALHIAEHCGAWSIEIEQSDGTEYTCWLSADGQQRQCSCKAFTFGRDSLRECKHTKSVAELRSILTAIFSRQEVGTSW